MKDYNVNTIILNLDDIINHYIDNLKTDNGNIIYNEYYIDVCKNKVILRIVVDEKKNNE